MLPVIVLVEDCHARTELGLLTMIKLDTGSGAAMKATLSRIRASRLYCPPVMDSPTRKVAVPRLLVDSDEIGKDPFPWTRKRPTRTPTEGLPPGSTSLIWDMIEPLTREKLSNESWP